MIYYAQRASSSYRKNLGQISKTNEPYHICSVIGGLSFLHALNRSTRSLILVDPDPEVHSYCRMILSLLEKTRSGREFFTLLTSCQVKECWWEKGSFGDRIDISSEISSILDNPELLKLYQSTYGKMKLHPHKAEGLIDESQIKFFDFDLSPMSFSWGIGTGNFTNEDTFQELKLALKSTYPIYIQSRFETLCLEKVLSSLEGKVFLLASNTESPLFTEADIIFRKVQQETPREVQYISWTRNIRLLPAKDWEKEGLRALRAIFSGDYVFTLNALFEMPNIVDTAKKTVTFKDLQELKENKHYGWGTFFIHLDYAKFKETSELLGDLIGSIIPSYPRIVFWSSSPASALLAVLEKNELEKSYELTNIDWYGRSFLMIWDLRGRFGRLKE